MMKRFLFIISLVLVSFTGSSQILISIIFGDKLNSDGLEFGLDGGINMSNISGLESKSYAVDFHLGMYFDIQLKDQWWLNTGIMLKSSQGASQLTENDVLALYPSLSAFQDTGSYSQSLGFFNVPVMLKYRFKNHFYTELGCQVSLLTKSRLHYNHKFDEVEIVTSIDNKDSFNNVDFGALASVGYKLRKGKGMNIGIKYYYGLLDITKSSDFVNRNNVIYFKVDVPIGKEKEDKPKK